MHFGKQRLKGRADQYPHLTCFLSTPWRHKIECIPVNIGKHTYVCRCCYFLRFSQHLVVRFNLSINLRRIQELLDDSIDGRWLLEWRMVWLLRWWVGDGNWYGKIFRLISDGHWRRTNNPRRRTMDDGHWDRWIIRLMGDRYWHHRIF